MQTAVYVALGSNLGEPVKNVRDAAQRLAVLADGGVQLSSLYRAPAEGMGEAPDFVNAVAGFATDLAAAQLLTALKQIETAMGRPPNHARNISRVIDLDIIGFGDRSIAQTDLVVPHPRAHLRAFVLLPLAEIAPRLVLPGQTLTVAELAGRVAASARISVITEQSPHA